ncbi:hypothetical protein NDU88_011699 [Pleurodeles waltl]|uniref:Uncharacterized protein n=1 Tax=Pleurodeles waltl TaxID=8319 RepID=A0AAV7R153_PLEWA|nr:hypothetical protein NDU88_011699 [Pleurodeles waltl]
MTDAPGLATLLLKRGWKLQGAPPTPLVELWILPGHFPSISRGRFNSGWSPVAGTVVRLLLPSLLLLLLSSPYQLGSSVLLVSRGANPLPLPCWPRKWKGIGCHAFSFWVGGGSVIPCRLLGRA